MLHSEKYISFAVRISNSKTGNHEIIEENRPVDDVHVSEWRSKQSRCCLSLCNQAEGSERRRAREAANSVVSVYTSVIYRAEYYEPKFIMRSRDSSSLRIIDIWTFRSLKSNKRYIIEVEGFENEFWGLKFYWKGVEKSKNRYSLLTNDYEPRTIVRSCVEVMLEYYRKNRLASFGFVAAPDLEGDVKGRKVQEGSRRFRFYQRMMINLFGPETFCQIADTTSTIYLLVNKAQLSTGAVTIRDIERRINQTYMGEYVIND